MRTDLPVYEHRQISMNALFAGALALALFGLWIAWTSEFWPWIAGAATLSVIAVFHALTIRVDEAAVSWRFGPGLFRKSVPVSEIVGAVPVRNRWWYGWGIRYTSHGWLYNVDGLDAVEITRQNGKTFRLGTDEPDALASAIRARMEA